MEYTDGFDVMTSDQEGKLMQGWLDGVRAEEQAVQVEPEIAVVA